MAKRPRTDAQRRAELAQEAKKRQSGEWVQVKATLKAKDDVERFRSLRARFPDLTDAGIVKLALRELDGGGNGH